MVGTFDADNFGDMLFPLLAQRELPERLRDLELVTYGLRAKARPGCGYDVRPLAALADEIDGFDLLLIGGGHLLRHDKAIARAYVPQGRGVHLPTGLWFAPAVIAAAAGVPVAWNALGVSPTWPAWAIPLLLGAAGATAYRSVRDEVSRAALTRAGVHDVALVPDTAVGVRRLIGPTPSPRSQELLGAHGVEGRYAVLQAALPLLPHREHVRRYCEAAERAGITVVEVAVGPIHGDAPGALWRAPTVPV
jgi:lipopolysaccharide transport system ATP-binding protein